MLFNIKKQLIILLLNGASYSTLSRYLKTVTTKQQLDSELSLIQINNLLRQILSDSAIKMKINIDLNPELYKNLNTLCEQAIMIGEENYPSLWYQIPQAPIIVFYRGDLSILRSAKVSIIGTRKISTYGKDMTKLITKAFSKKDWASVSGLALGVDALVHQTAINHPQGKSIAIIPCGFDYYYPRVNQSIQVQLEKSHLILSEYLPASKPKKHYFIERNRLVAGISKVTVVIEAAQKSGSLITANYALQFNRELFVLPGRLTDPQSMGCLELIEAGASPIININKLTNDIDEVFQFQGY